MKIYMAAYDGCDSYGRSISCSIGYFLDKTKAEECCKYFERTNPTRINSSWWYIEEYDLDETDYASLNKKLDEQENIEKITSLLAKFDIQVKTEDGGYRPTYDILNDISKVVFADNN